MRELLKVGTKNGYGVATPLQSDLSGVLSVTNSKRFLPFRGQGYTEQLAAQRKQIKEKYVGAERVLMGHDANMLTWWTYLEGDDYGVTLDNTVKDDVGYSAKIQTRLTSSYTPQINFAETQDFSAYDALHMWIHCDDLSKINYFNITFEAPDSSNKYAIRTSASASMLKEMGAIFGDGEIAIQKADFSATGTPSWSTVKKIYITLQAKTAGTFCAINVANMRMIKQKPQNAKIIMRMDDGLQSVHTVAMPIFEKYNLVVSGVVIEGYSVEDDGEEISFCVYCYNVQPGVEINYFTGTNRKAGDNTDLGPTDDTQLENQPSTPTVTVYILNTKTKKIHKTTCGNLPENGEETTKDIDALLLEGYTKCGICKP